MKLEADCIGRPFHGQFIRPEFHFVKLVADVIGRPFHGPRKQFDRTRKAIIDLA